MFEQITLATWCTLLRLFLIIPLVLSIYNSNWLLALFLFCVASVTDFLDGYLARMLNECTTLGACLDAFVDKILIMATFISCLIVAHPMQSLIPLWLVLICLVKESVQMLGALFLIVNGYADSLGPTILGKITMIVQILFVIWVLTSYYLQIHDPVIHNVLVLLVGLISSICFLHYIVIGLYRLCTRLIRN